MESFVTISSVHQHTYLLKDRLKGPDRLLFSYYCTVVQFSQGGVFTRQICSADQRALFMQLVFIVTSYSILSLKYLLIIPSVLQSADHQSLSRGVSLQLGRVNLLVHQPRSDEMQEHNEQQSIDQQSTSQQVHGRSFT